jgi:low affinity Fe/Cu permease
VSQTFSWPLLLAIKQLVMLILIIRGPQLPSFTDPSVCVWVTSVSNILLAIVVSYQAAGDADPDFAN